jgi:hypothetical protein
MGLLLLGACATRSGDVQPLRSDPVTYSSWRCDTLFDEMDTVQQRAADVAYAVDARAGNNVLALSVGVTVFWPALLAMRPDGPDAAELARLKGRFEALVQAAEQRPCGPRPSLMTSAQAAQLPVAVGERLVYEERASGNALVRPLTLRLQALRRGQLDFAASLGGPVADAPWVQDATGNLLGPPGLGNVLYWTRLLQRDMQLGDVLVGEMHGVGGATASVRGQVIALGVQSAIGRPFDAAVVELFGEVRDDATPARIAGAMVVDRKSGVLLRLELRSANPSFSLRRMLLRIEPAA